MDWVKRNLGFVIGGVVAVGLLLFSGFYLYSNSEKNKEARQRLEGEYVELQRLSNLKPHPGKGSVDNIKLAQQQREELLALRQELAKHFKPIPPIPDKPQVSGVDFSAGLRRTIERLNRQATMSSVIVPSNYNFSFEAEKRLVKFASGSLQPLAVQLGEVNAICDVLFAAKINKLTGLRREPVSPDDRTGPQSDYLWTPSITNELAVISPYEISFESFSAELADVIDGFANSPHGIVVKGLYVGPASGGEVTGSRYGRTAASRSTAPIYAPSAPTPSTPPMSGADSSYRRPTFRRPTFDDPEASAAASAPPVYQPPAVLPSGAAVAGTTSQTLIDEQPLSITLLVEVIKLLPPRTE